MKRYRAAKGARFGHAKAQAYGEALEQLERRLGHPPTTEEILADAKRQESALHDCIEWNTKRAAYQYWLVQIRNVVNHIEEVVLVRNKQVPIRAWFSVMRHPEDPVRYVRASSVSENKFMRQQIVSAALEEIKNWTERYRNYREFRPIVSAVKKVSKDRVTARRETARQV